MGLQISGRNQSRRRRGDSIFLPLTKGQGHDMDLIGLKNSVHGSGFRVQGSGFRVQVQVQVQISPGGGGWLAPDVSAHAVPVSD